MFKEIPIEELAENAFVKAERVRMLETMNAPQSYEERKQAFVALALARKEAAEAESLLTRVIRHRENPPPAPRFTADPMDPFGPIVVR